jgi:hypothetical protein
MDIDFDFGPVENAAVKAADASRLLANPAFNDAFESLMSDIEKRLFSTNLPASDEREQLFYLHRAAQMFVNNIAQRINHSMLNEPTL